MVNEWITPIYDRNYADIQDVQYDPTMQNPKGCYNAIDLNRIENNTAYCAEYMLEHKIIRVMPQITCKTNWNGNDIPTTTDMRRIIHNVMTLMELSNPMIFEDLPTLKIATQINFSLANDIERALDVMHNQPDLPIDYFVLTLHDGMITTIERLDGSTETINASQAYIAETEIAHIVGVPPEPDSQYKLFTAWSGNVDDLAFVRPDINTQNATFEGQYHNVELTANFRTAYPRRLTLTNAYISPNGDDHAESGPTTGIFYAGDNIMIIANRASTGKAFHHWEGTQAALENISTADLDPSTVWLSMPDCDVNLNPFYINAGQHTVNVTNGSGSGLYNYGDDVYISADVPDHYGFDNWSGDTSYLEDIYSSSQSFKMRDYNISFRANYSYRYSYNNVQVINGKIRVNGEDVNKASNLMQSSSYALIPEPPAGQGIDYWSVQGLGSVSGNTFTVGDGNGVVTGHYAPLHTLYVNNINNGGGSTPYSIVQGHTQQITTSSSNGYWYFRRWEENGVSISTSRTINITINDSDRTITAVYEYVEPTPTEYVTLTQTNKNNSGSSTSSTVVKGNYITVSSGEVVGDYILEGIYKNGAKVTSSTSYGFYCSADTTIEFRYRAKESYTLTVQNGHIVETGSSTGTYLERTQVQITADDPSAGATFTGWSVTSGSLYSSTSSKTGYVTIGRSNATISAQYKNLRTIQVTTNSGTNTYTMVQGNSQRIVANPAPSTYEFDTWVCTSGDATFANRLSQDTYVYANSQNSIVEARYKAIPWFTVEVENGYIQIDNQWVTSGTVLRNSQPYIQMKPAPEGYQFFQWEVLIGDDNDVYQPLAETTYLRNVTHNIKVRATYYIPDPETTYEFTINRIDGTHDVYHIPAGGTQEFYCTEPPEGLKFYRWLGDYQYLTVGTPRQRYYGGTYEIPQVVHMPARNITISEDEYKPLDWTLKYHLYMSPTNIAECLISRTVDEETEEVTEVWGTDGEYEEGTEVEIRVKYVPEESYFSEWVGDTDAETALVTNVIEPISSIVMADFDVHLTAQTQLKQTYTFTVNNGGVSGQYYKDKKVSVFFIPPVVNGEQQTFTQWTGDVAYISLWDGGVFDVLEPGTSEYPQEVRMPERAITLTANYTTSYKLTVNSGVIDEGGEYFAPNTTLHITANTIQGKNFVKWVGDISGIGSIYDPTTTITTTNSPKTLTATYANETDRNNVGYGLISFKASDIINITDITIISGTIGIGFIITDSLGHLYVVTDVNQTTVTVSRMTKIQKGGDVYE